MPLKVTFELSDHDLKYFRKTLAEANSRSKRMSSEKLIANAAQTLEELPTDAPEFVLERTEKLRSMIEMVQDEEWRLEGKDRERVVEPANARLSFCPADEAAGRFDLRSHGAGSKALRVQVIRRRCPDGPGILGAKIGEDCIDIGQHQQSVGFDRLG